MSKHSRYAALDTLRGWTVIQMILYHGTWDLVYIFGMPWDWYRSDAAYLWQQSICWTFILLSGFCAGMSQHPLKRGLMVFGLGAIVSLATALFMPENIVIFGVLTLIGTCMLLMIPLRPLLQKLPAGLGLVLFAALFFVTRNVNEGVLGFEDIRIAALPDGLYRNYLTAFLGFPQAGFYSTDYFSLLPWLFLFLTGFSLYGLLKTQLPKLTWKGIAPLNFIGRHALMIYAVHQPLLYGICWLCFAI